MPEIIQSFLLIKVKTIELFRVFIWEKLQAEGMPNMLLIILYLEGQHYNLQSLQYFSPSIFYAFTWPYFLKIVLSSRIINFKTHNNQRTRVLRWLGRENEENVARTKIDMAGPPPLLQESMNLTLKDKKKWIILITPPTPNMLLQSHG